MNSITSEIKLAPGSALLFAAKKRMKAGNCPFWFITVTAVQICSILESFISDLADMSVYQYGLSPRRPLRPTHRNKCRSATHAKGGLECDNVPLVFPRNRIRHSVPRAPESGARMVTNANQKLKNGYEAHASDTGV
eukprot:1395011-Amorphochlora_amoeboformis.AAC.1